ncbi:hypothetical protein MRB53_032729 [Persea americana]|uniref:Uncharacterized protein n=1 Tax=Persea americana TaxID=3435 RepID=A0ACC2KSP1_PERAE|nr:hypothetical protein MRB53_032729 [Persea americana]
MALIAQDDAAIAELVCSTHPLQHHEVLFDDKKLTCQMVLVAFASRACVVKYSVDPFVDFRESIMEMVRHMGVRDWREMDELVYCYVVLNPLDVHGFIEDAFMSFCSCHLG